MKNPYEVRTDDKGSGSEDDYSGDNNSDDGGDSDSRDNSSDDSDSEKSNSEDYDSQDSGNDRSEPPSDREDEDAGTFYEDDSYDDVD